MLARCNSRSAKDQSSSGLPSGLPRSSQRRYASAETSFAPAAASAPDSKRRSFDTSCSTAIGALSFYISDSLKDHVFPVLTDARPAARLIEPCGSGCEARRRGLPK